MMDMSSIPSVVVLFAELFRVVWTGIIGIVEGLSYILRCERNDFPCSYR